MKSIKEQFFQPMIDAYHKIEDAYIKRLNTNGVLNKVGIVVSATALTALLISMGVIGVGSTIVTGLGIGVASLTTLTSAVLIARHVYANKKFKSDVRSFEEDYRVPFDSIPEVEEQLFIEKEEQEIFGNHVQSKTHTTQPKQDISKYVKRIKEQQEETEDEETRTR